nr:MAG TPA: hypothetical protein [Caudoviricetes sp.]
MDSPLTSSCKSFSCGSPIVASYVLLLYLDHYI